MEMWRISILHKHLEILKSCLNCGPARIIASVLKKREKGERIFPKVRMLNVQLQLHVNLKYIHGKTYKIN